MRSFKIVFLILTSVLTVAVYADKIIAHDYYIAYAGQKIHLKEKKLASAKSAKVMLLLNSLSIPALSAFDVEDYSLMNDLASRGYAVWGIDFIGQGSSSYPSIMNISPAPCGIYPLQAQQAVGQLQQAVNYILKATANTNLALLAWSWGSVVGAMYAIQNPQQINHLVLYGAMYSAKLAPSQQAIFVQPYAGQDNNFSESLPAYQNIPWQVINKHWQMMRGANQSIASESAIRKVAKVYAAADPHPNNSQASNSLRRAMGPMKDLYSIWQGRPVYDISQLTTPTLVIYGDQDLFADHGLYSKLTKVKIKQQIELKQATHWLIYEKTRDQFVAAVVKFLNDE